jgi:hypothetical protein
MKMSRIVIVILIYLRQKPIELKSALAQINQFFSDKPSKLPRAGKLLTAIW